MPITRYMSNSGGLNTTDSPISMQDNQATGNSYNYEYSRTGAFIKVLSPTTVNSSPDTQLTTLGLGMHHDASTDLRTVIRAAGTKIQTVDLNSAVITNVAADTVAAGTDFLTSGSQQPVVMVPFNTAAGGVQLNMAGGGLQGVYSYIGDKITKNGVVAPTGAITATVNTSAGGAFPSAGTYYYGVQYRKRSTQAVSNVALDISGTVVTTADTVTIDLSGITGLDTTLMDQIIIWRSAVNGVTAFTTGSIIAELASTVTTYTDTGDSIADSQNAPRADNLVLDNSVLPAGEYKYVNTFKRRLVTCQNSTIYLSDLEKCESWPTVNFITVPSGGPITGFGVIGIPSEYTTGSEEYLAIFKENELWVLTGSDLDTWELKFVDRTGCVGQSLVVSLNGFVSWMGYNGIFMWEGKGRPVRVSRPIHSMFDNQGTIDKSKLFYGVGCHYAKSNQVIWRITDKLKGTNKLSIKMDTRLTTLQYAQNVENNEADGVFICDYDSNSYYGLTAFLPSTKDEILLAGDDAGYVYTLYTGTSTAVPFYYETKPFDMGAPEVNKRFKRVLVFLEKLTPNDLTLNYWVDYRGRSEYQSSIAVPMTPTKGLQSSLWDIALWDKSLWDDYSADIGIVVFNLHSEENNAEGISLKLQFQQIEANAPARIYGYAVEWEELGLISIPTGQVQ